MPEIEDQPVARPDYHQLVREEVVPLMPKMGGTLLDVGGGVGATAMRMKELGLVERAGVVDLVAASANPGIDFAHGGNLEDPALLDRVTEAEGPFSAILCLDVLEHLVDPWDTVARLHQSLAPGGVIVASIPNIRHFTASLPLFFGNKWTLEDDGILDRTHLRFFVRETAIELMTHSGLVLEEVRGSASNAKRIHLFRKLTLGLLNSFTDLQYLIRVRRAD